jgi:FixJ family two-component response regulator
VAPGHGAGRDSTITVALLRLLEGAGVAEAQQLDQAQQQLQAQLKRLTGGLVPDIKLPKIKL